MRTKSAQAENKISIELEKVKCTNKSEKRRKKVTNVSLFTIQRWLDEMFVMSIRWSIKVATTTKNKLIYWKMNTKYCK